ncbi:MAG: GIY-YIG nuclease family protein [Candidatus Peribacteraceae bacterium]|nr:GIY-YIG nuclease family protein [Candidatus Peribacteraceae bacterium]
MFYVYILKSLSNSGQTYVGFSTSLKRRIEEHNFGKSPHTKKFIPWKLSMYLAFEDETKARNFEKYLKTASGIAFRSKRF